MEEARSDPRISPAAMKRLADMLDFVETVSRWYDQMLGVPKSKLVALIKMGAKVAAVLPLGRKKEPGGQDR